MNKTMSIRMDEENYDFLNKLSKEGRGRCGNSSTRAESCWP